MDNAVHAMKETINELQALGKKVVIFSPPPSSGFNIGSCLERKNQGKLVIGAPTKDCSVPLSDYRAFFYLTSEFLSVVKSETGVSVIYFDTLLCDNERCKTELDGKFLYVDQGHLTHQASTLLMSELGFH